MKLDFFCGFLLLFISIQFVFTFLLFRLNSLQTNLNELQIFVKNSIQSDNNNNNDNKIENQLISNINELKNKFQLFQNSLNEIEKKENVKILF